MIGAARCVQFRHAGRGGSVRESTCRKKRLLTLDGHCLRAHLLGAVFIRSSKHRASGSPSPHSMASPIPLRCKRILEDTGADRWPPCSTSQIQVNSTALPTPSYHHPNPPPPPPMVRGDPLRSVKGLDVAYSVQTYPERTRDNISHQPLRHNLRSVDLVNRSPISGACPRFPGLVVASGLALPSFGIKTGISQESIIFPMITVLPRRVDRIGQRSSSDATDTGFVGDVAFL